MIKLPFVPSFLNHCPAVLRFISAKEGTGTWGSYAPCGTRGLTSKIQALRKAGHFPPRILKGGKAGGQGRKVSETHTASRLLHRPALLCHVGEGALMWNPLPWASS